MLFVVRCATRSQHLRACENEVAWLPHLEPTPLPRETFRQRLRAFVAAGHRLFRG